MYKPSMHYSDKTPLLLDRIPLTTSTPLHIAALRGHLDFTRFLLHHKPTLSTTLDSLRRSSLHLAAASGHLAVFEELLRIEQGGSNLCNVKDDDGRTPLHLASMNEHLDVIKALNRASPPEVTGKEIILQDCVGYNRFESLKLLIELWDEEEVAKMVDGEGNTLLHLAALRNQTQTLKFLLNKPTIKANKNAVNLHGFTPLDAMDHCPRDLKALETREILIESGIMRARDLKPNQSKEPKPSKNIPNPKKKFLSRIWNNHSSSNTKWVEKERGNLIISAAIISALTFQAGISPPGGVYMDSNNGHNAGMSVAADVDNDTFSLFMTFNTIPLIVSMMIILVLVSGINLRNKFVVWVLMIGMFTVFVFLLVAYMQSIALLSPDIWANQAAAYLCVAWIVLAVVFSGVYTVCLIVWLGAKSVVAKRREMRTQEMRSRD